MMQLKRGSGGATYFSTLQGYAIFETELYVHFPNRFRLLMKAHVGFTTLLKVFFSSPEPKAYKVSL